VVAGWDLPSSGGTGSAPSWSSNHSRFTYAPGEEMIQHAAGAKRYDHDQCGHGSPLELVPLSNITPRAEEIDLHYAVGHFHHVLAS
jgi:hypothetical protein